MTKVNLGRALFILAVAAFFVYRYLHLEGTIYLIYIVLFGGLGLLSLPGILSARWQNVSLNLGISLLFLDLVFAEINWTEFGAALTGANYWWLIPSTICIFIHLYFRILRSQALLKPMGDVPFWPTFRALNIGILGNTVLPAKAGEFLRAYVLGRSTGLAKTGIFATIVVERILDGLTILLLLFGVIIIGVRDETLQLMGLFGGIFYVGAVIALILFMAKRHWADILINKFLPQMLAEFALDILNGFSSGLAILKNPGLMSLVLLWNFFTWAIVPFSFYFALRTFDYGVTIPWQTPVLLLPALGLALTIPGVPGGVGLVQFATKLTLTITFAGLPVADNFAELVAAATIIIHISQLGPEVIIGAISFVIEGLSTSDVQAGREMSETV